MEVIVAGFGGMLWEVFMFFLRHLNAIKEALKRRVKPDS
jgi:hypothetical protein